MTAIESARDAILNSHAPTSHLARGAAELSPQTGVNALAGYSMSHGAVVASGLTNPFSYFSASTVPVASKPSVGFVLAVGTTF